MEMRFRHAFFLTRNRRIPTLSVRSRGVVLSGASPNNGFTRGERAMNLIKWIGASVITMAAAHAAGATTLPGPLVTAQWLKDHQDEVTVVDIRDDMKTF